jgi:hypothetical protein
MEGSCKFFDTKMGKMITAYKVLIAGLTDGKYFIWRMSDGNKCH